MININKSHWYDGLFYDKLIAPNQDKSFRLVKTIIKENSSVLDVGCGTGRLAFQLTDKCRKIDGIDLSKRNITLAKKKLQKNSSEKISFYHTDEQSFLNNKNKHYDYAVISYVVHEIQEKHRIKLLNTLSGSADKIIIVDYLYPRPLSFWSVLNEVVEFAAGKNHYTNFKTFISNKGIKGLAEKTGLKTVNEIQNKPATSHIVVLTK